MIGVFDSGSGGLTILKALRDTLPDQDFLYFGDHRNAPYGHRDNDQIVDLTRAGVKTLMDRGCSLIILACNTAAAVALRSLQQQWLEDHYPGNRILGVLVPMVEAITGQPWLADAAPDGSHRDRILLFATSKTVASGAYHEEITKRAPNVELVQKACPGLVDAIEGGAGERPLKGLIEGYISEIDVTGASAAVLGCTHFPLVEKYFHAALPSTIKILSQPDIVAAALANYLARHPGFLGTGTGMINLLTSGDPVAATNVGQRFLEQDIKFTASPPD